MPKEVPEDKTFDLKTLIKKSVLNKKLHCNVNIQSTNGFN